MAVSKDVLASMAIRIGLDTASMNKDLNKIAGSMNILKSGVRAVGGLIATTFSAYAIADFGKELVTLAGKLQGVKAAFEMLDNDALLGDLRKATKGTIDDLTLMQSAIRAQNFKIPLDQLSTYLEFARRRAKATGEDIDYLVESIIVGLGRQSPKIIDNLGISLIQVQQEVKKVGDFGLAVGNIIKQEMGNMADDIDTVTEQTESLSTSWMNFKLMLAEELTPTLSKLFNQLQDIVKVLGSDKIRFLNKLLVVGGGIAGAGGSRANRLAEELKTQEHLAQLERERLEWLDELNNKLDETATVEKTVWADLNMEIELYETLWEKATSKEQLLEYGLKLEALKEEKKQLEDIAKLYLEQIEIQKQRARLNEFLGIATPGIPIGYGIDVQSRDKEGKLDLAFGDSMDQYMINLNARNKEQTQIFIGDLQARNAEVEVLNQALEASFEDMVGSIAFSMGEFVATGKFNGNAILESFAGMAEQLGKLAISMGITAEALKKSLASHPAMAIAAGVALVALAGAVRSGISNIQAGGSASASMPQSYGTSNPNINRTYGQVDKRLQVEVVGTIKGEDIRLANARATLKHNSGY